MAKNPRDIADKWARNYSNSGEDFEKAINALTENPMLQAIAKGDAYIAGVRAAYESKKWEKGLRKVDFAAWKAKTIKLAKARMADGANEAKPKVIAFMEFWMPKMTELRQKVRAMPKATVADRRARLLAAFEFNSANKYKTRD